MEIFWGVVWALAPTVLVGLLFWYIIRSIVTADKRERAIAAKYEAEERARLASEGPHRSS